MSENTTTKVSNEDLKKAFEGESKLDHGKKTLSEKQLSIFLAIGAVCLVSGIGLLLYALLGNPTNEVEANFPTIPSESVDDEILSNLTGEVLSDESAKTAPTYCVQTPNGTDGARPQAGLNEAGVVFEAIAEAGITRFAAIYQGPSSAIIGPIRSLRLYFLEWDTPFDCTIVHAGGADDALAAVESGKYRDLSEDYNYMYRGTYGGRLWNNLFTTSANLQKFSTDKNYSTSDVKGFDRMTPSESEKSRAAGMAHEKLVITQPAEGDTSITEAAVTEIGLKFGGLANFNVNYTYDAETNTYARSYQNGVPHEVYNCPSEDLGEKNPEDVCALKQLNPAVVIAMMVPEWKASDGYHENIDAIGSGDAYVFQNGAAIRGMWKKASREDQIKFVDSEGEEIKLAPGQTFVSAVPNYGSVEY